jgi:hypothetical protein
MYTSLGSGHKGADGKRALKEVSLRREKYVSYHGHGQELLGMVIIKSRLSFSRFYYYF